MGDREKPGWWDAAQIKAEQACLERMKVQLRINLTDVEAECSHGALPLDRRKPAGCVCWTPAVVAALAQRRQDNPDYSDAA